MPLCHFWVASAVSCSALEIHWGMPWRFRLTVILIIRGSCLSCCDCGPSFSWVLYRSIWLCEWKITPFDKWFQFRLALLDPAGYLAKSFLKHQQPSRSSVTEKSSIQIHLMSLNLSRIESALKPPLLISDKTCWFTAEWRLFWMDLGKLQWMDKIFMASLFGTQASCTRVTARTSSFPSSPLSSEASWVMGEGAVSPVQAATGWRMEISCSHL